MRGASVDILTECIPENLYILADRMRLKQILLNLSFNATKFVEKGYIRLRAQVMNNDKDDSQAQKENSMEAKVAFYVEDSGPGIPECKQKALFSKFQDSLDVLNQGTGIGLALCKQLSSLMGATLSLDNDFRSGIEGCPGTRFVLTLNQQPLSLENGNGVGEMTNAHASIRDLMHERDGFRKELPLNISVLFVDDDAMLRKMFSRVLQSVAPSWSIRECANGETALRIVDEEKFDLIFVDQYMASVEKQLLGTETVHAMRAKGVESIICGLSANDVEDQFSNAGGDYFMYKPFPCKKDALKDELLQMLACSKDEERAPGV